MNIAAIGLRLVVRATRLWDQVRPFFYQVVLMRYRCPKCDCQLAMVGEGRCRCRACGYELDPTIAFQRCSTCDGRLELRIRRYHCRPCGIAVPSRFLFDGLVFDADYFRRKMAEHRERQNSRREQVRKLLAESRSLPLDLAPAGLEAVPGLVEALNSLTTGLAPLAQWLPQDEFDLQRYQRHLKSHIGETAVEFDRLPPLDENARRDRIWRFVALVFMAHAGLIELRQDGADIMVMRHETYGEGQDFPGNLEEADGNQRLVGTAQVW